MVGQTQAPAALHHANGVRGRCGPNDGQGRKNVNGITIIQVPGAPTAFI